MDFKRAERGTPLRSPTQLRKAWVTNRSTIKHFPFQWDRRLSGLLEILGWRWGYQQSNPPPFQPHCCFLQQHAPVYRRGRTLDTLFMPLADSLLSFQWSTVFTPSRKSVALSTCRTTIQNVPGPRAGTKAPVHDRSGPLSPSPCCLPSAEGLMNSQFPFITLTQPSGETHLFYSSTL